MAWYNHIGSLVRIIAMITFNNIYHMYMWSYSRAYSMIHIQIFIFIHIDECTSKYLFTFDNWLMNHVHSTMKITSAHTGILWYVYSSGNRSEPPHGSEKKFRDALRVQSVKAAGHVHLADSKSKGYPGPISNSPEALQHARWNVSEPITLLKTDPVRLWHYTMSPAESWPTNSLSPLDGSALMPITTSQRQRNGLT
jgi:hypothetical protein